jgi:hypothetical protein
MMDIIDITTKVESKLNRDLNQFQVEKSTMIPSATSK